jgi:beta-mannosidase
MEKQTIPAELPGDNYSALLAAGEIPTRIFGRNELASRNRRREWEFSRDFEFRKSCWPNSMSISTARWSIPSPPSDQRAQGGFHRKRLPPLPAQVRALLRPGKNTISVLFKSAELEAKKEAEKMPFPIPMNGCSKVEHLNLIRKAHCHGGWDWGVTLMVSGICDPFYLFGVDGGRIDAAWTDQKHDGNRSNGPPSPSFSPKSRVAPPSPSASTAKTAGQRLVEAGRNLVRAKFEVKKPRHWWPNGTARRNSTRSSSKRRPERSKTDRAADRRSGQPSGRGRRFDVLPGQRRGRFRQGRQLDPADALPCARPERVTRTCSNPPGSPI